MILIYPRHAKTAFNALRNFRKESIEVITKAKTFEGLVKDVELMKETRELLRVVHLGTPFNPDNKINLWLDCGFTNEGIEMTVADLDAQIRMSTGSW